VTRRVLSLQTVSLVARMVLAGVFVVAGALKLADPQAAVQAVRAYELLPKSLEAPVGWGLPAFEVALGLLLAFGLFTRVCAGAAAALLTIFIAGVASAAARGLSIDCGCFGGGGTVAPGETKYVTEIIRDVGLLTLAAWLVWKPTSRFSLD
jgi:uncharacterized membrane protein YphA (DoxX/SURF4 family)